MRLHERAIFPRGFQCASRNCGLKAAGSDLSLFFTNTPAAAAAVFTQSRFPGAPIIAGREIIRGGRLSAIVVNSKISNVGTGAAGVENAFRMGEMAAAELGIPASEVMMSSTGIIGQRLPMDRIDSGLRGIAAELQSDPLPGAEGIMTTDTYAKVFSASVGDAVITWVGKGSGMIEPNLATMLVYIFTDADLSAPELDRMLRGSVADSFNMLSVDTDTSTSDTCAILANGRAGQVNMDHFEAALRAGCIRMAEMLARDGEGATKLLRGRITGARNESDARRLAKSIINSPLVKTMAFGADPNAGRILMAVGKCFDCNQDPERISVWINGVPVYTDGERTPYDDSELRELLSGDPVDIQVDVAAGVASATAFGCDLTHGYIDENAAYSSS